MNNNLLLMYIIITYLINGIPFGLIICKIFKKIDIREYGSKNIGATNVARICGMKYAVFVFILDGLKSFLPIFISKIFFDINYVTVILFSAVCGHIFSFWLKGKGGKGISSTILGSFALDYRLGLIISVSWLLVFKFTKISALAALISVLNMNIASYFLFDKQSFVILIFLTLLIFWAHRNNIKRLLLGEEVGFKNNIL